MKEKPKIAPATAHGSSTSSDYRTRLVTPFSGPMTEHASDLATTLEARLRRRTKRTAAQKAMDYDRQRRENMKKEKVAPITIFEDSTLTPVNAMQRKLSSQYVAMVDRAMAPLGREQDGKENAIQMAREPLAVKRGKPQLF